MTQMMALRDAIQDQLPTLELTENFLINDCCKYRNNKFFMSKKNTQMCSLYYTYFLKLFFSEKKYL